MERDGDQKRMLDKTQPLYQRQPEKTEQATSPYSSERSKNSNNATKVNGRTEPAQNNTWILYGTTGNPKQAQQQTVRSHAATASWAARKKQWQNASTSMRGGSESAHRQTNGSVLGHAPAAVINPLLPPQPEDAWWVLERVGADCTMVLRTSSIPAGSGSAQFVKFMSALRERRQWLTDGVVGSSLAQRATRMMLWDSLSSTTLLAQLGLLIAGTRTQSRGTLPDGSLEIDAIMRGVKRASVEMLQSAFSSPECESSTPLALALCAGWERRYGDGEAWRKQLLLWQKAALPTTALETNITALADVVLEIIRQDLDDRSLTLPSGIVFAPAVVRDAYTAASENSGKLCVPPGFRILPISRPEVRSLLALVTDVYRSANSTDEALQGRHKLSFALVAWCPWHTRVVGLPVNDPSQIAMERQYADQAELSALFHVRATTRLLNSFLTFSIMNALEFLPLGHYTVQRALDVCCASYMQRLKTQALTGTRFGPLAFWSRYVMCSLSSDANQAMEVERLMNDLGLSGWLKVKDTLGVFMDENVPGIWEKCHALYQKLTNSKMDSAADRGYDARMKVRNLWQ